MKYTEKCRTEINQLKHIETQHSVFVLPFLFDLVQRFGEKPSQVFCGRFYMGIFGSDTPKRHVLYSNNKGMLTKILEKSGYMSRQQQQQCPGTTSIKYVDKRGAKRHVGVKKALKESQCLGYGCDLSYTNTML